MTTNPTLISSGISFSPASQENALNISGQDLLDDLNTVIDMAIGGKPDFSAVSDAIRRARNRATTQKSHLLTQTAMDVGISLAADFETNPNDEEDDDVYRGW